jgi:hypothetical protein
MRTQEYTAAVEVCVPERYGLWPSPCCLHLRHLCSHARPTQPCPSVPRPTRATPSWAGLRRSSASARASRTASSTGTATCVSTQRHIDYPGIFVHAHSSRGGRGGAGAGWASAREHIVYVGVCCALQTGTSSAWTSLLTRTPRMQTSM